jgi:hypothetical protein
LELIDAALGVFGLPPQLVVAAQQVVEQSLALLGIVRETWDDAHNMNYSRDIMLFKSFRDDFLRFFRDSACVLEPLALACALQVDSGEDHGELRRLEFDAVACGVSAR